MKKDKRLEREIKRLRRKKKKEDWFLFYGGWIIFCLIILGLLFRVIVGIKNGFYETIYQSIPKVGTVCMR